MSRSGMLLAASVLLVSGSGFAEFRPEIAGLAIHPYLVLLLPLVPAALGRVSWVPRAVVMCGAALVLLISVSLLINGDGAGEAIKLVTAGLTVVVCATAIRTEQDFLVASSALIAACVIIIGGRLVTGGDSGFGSPAGANFMAGIGDKNVFSLYALPAILLGAVNFTESQRSPALQKVLLAGGTSVLIAAIFASANRSGWLGVALIGVMVAAVRVSLRAALFVALAGGAIWLVGTQSAISEMIRWRIEQTQEGYGADDLRRALILNAFDVGLHNPLFGVGPRELFKQLAHRTEPRLLMVDAHNAFGYVIGAFGIPSFLALLSLQLSISFPTRRGALLTGPAKLARGTLRMLTVLWVVRALFTREILYTPAMAIALGLCLGLLMIRLPATSPLRAV